MRHRSRVVRVELVRSISRQASAQRSGRSPSRSVLSSASSPTARARSTSPALHNAAAHTISLLARCRADTARSARPAATAWPACRTAAAPSPAAIASSAATHARRMASRGARACATSWSARRSSTADAANRPTPSASAARPISASAAASGSAPASARARPSHPRARACQPSCRRNDARVLWASEASEAAGAARIRVARSSSALPYRPCPPAATARSHSWRGVIALGSGHRPGSSPKAAAVSAAPAARSLRVSIAVRIS